MLKIYGLKKTTLIDYPGHIACTAFTHGCTFRCPFCHNPELVIDKPDDRSSMTGTELLEFLYRRKGKLDGIVFSGGEPLLHIKELKPLIKSIKNAGFLVKIDTNGTFPDALKLLIDHKLVDFIAMDIKTTITNYPIMKATPRHIKAVLRSLALLKNSNVIYELRTTLVPGIHNEDILRNMMPLVAGVPRFVLQNFEPNGTVDPSFHEVKPFSREKMRSFLNIARSFNPSSTVRLPD